MDFHPPEEPSIQWVALDLALPYEMVDALADFCVEHGSNGVILRDDDTDIAELKAYFSPELWDAIKPEFLVFLADLNFIFPEFPDIVPRITTVDDENWAVAWKDHFTSLWVGRKFIVTPPWLEPEPGDRHIIIIEPAEAFGTGTHETTRGCLVLLEEVVEEVATAGGPFTMLDVGCGSGILAIACAKLGAEKVTAVDHDLMAIEAALRNVALNHMGASISLQCLSLEEMTGSYDIVAANLDAQTILSNRERLSAVCGRFVIISGIPLDQWDNIKGQIIGEDLKLLRELKQAEWGSGLFKKIH